MTAVVSAVVIIHCDYCCGERCGLSLRRWVIRRVPRRLQPPALRRRLLCVDLLRLAVVAILFVGFSPAVADDLPCLVRVNALGDAFTLAVMALRAHTFSNYSMLSVPESHAVLCGMVNCYIALWVNELIRAAQRSSPAAVPPPAGTVFDHSPMPEFVRTLEFGRGGGEVLRLVLSSMGSGVDKPSKRKATASPAGSPGSKGKVNSSLPQACRMFARTGECNWSPCKFLHEAPAASASSPSPPARREEGPRLR